MNPDGYSAFWLSRKTNTKHKKLIKVSFILVRFYSGASSVISNLLVMQ